MKVALFEALPPGGARRVLADLVDRTPSSWTYEHFTIGRSRGSTISSTLPQPHSDPGSAVLDRMGFGGRFLSSTVAQHRLAREIDQQGFDLVIVNHDAITQTPPLLSSLSTPSMYICHEPRRSLVEYSARQRTREAHGISRRWLQAMTESALGTFERRWARQASLIVANSAFSAESIIRCYGVAPAVWHLGVDPQRFRRTDAKGAQPYVLSVGAIEPLKGHHLAIDALARLPAQSRPELNLVGERVLEPYQRALEQFAFERSVKLRVHRAVSDGNLVDLYSGALATLALGVLEPFGLSTLESIACGTPVIAVREGGYREVVVDGDNGLLVDRSARQLSGALNTMIGEHGFAPGKLRESILPYWSIDASAARFVHLAEALVAERLVSSDVLEVDGG